MITGNYYPIRQAVPDINNPINQVKFTQIVHILWFLEMQIIASSFMYIRYEAVDWSVSSIYIFLEPCYANPLLYAAEM